MDDDAEMLRRFQAATSGQELVELRDLATMLLGAESGAPRPSLRRHRLDGLHVMTVRLELDHSDPAIWREVEVRSDLSLAAIHEVVMAAYGWSGGHLYRFSLGGGPFDPQSELFLCPFDVEEGDDVGEPAAHVRLDETLQEPGDVLRYVYDYGDQWDLTLRVVAVRAGSADAPVARCTGGERVAPPEDCGGLTDADDLASLLDDPAAFDPAEVDAALRGSSMALEGRGLHSRLVELLARLRGTATGDDLLVRLLQEPYEEPDLAEQAAAYGALRWFLDRAYGDGIVLTGAGYLRPADVEAAAQVVPTVVHGYGKLNRETHVIPVLELRESMQRLGLLRKAKGRVTLTKAGEAARTDVDRLRDHLAGRLAPQGKDRFGDEASLLVLAYAATSPGGLLPLPRVAVALNDLGWSLSQGGRIQHYHLYRTVPVINLLEAITTDRPDARTERHRTSPTASALARQVIFGS